MAATSRSTEAADASDAIDVADAADATPTAAAADVGSSAVVLPSAEEVTALAPPNTEEVMDIDEGISTSSSWTAAHIESSSPEPPVAVPSATPSIHLRPATQSPVHSPITDDTPCLLPTLVSPSPPQLAPKTPETRLDVVPPAPPIAESLESPPDEPHSADVIPESRKEESSPAPTVESDPHPPIPPDSVAQTPDPDDSGGKSDPGPVEAVAVTTGRTSRKNRSRASKTAPAADACGSATAAAAAAADGNAVSPLPEAVSSLTRPVATEHRNSKILKQAEIFNNLTLAKTEPKSTMTLERPKKVTIYGFKVVVARFFFFFFSFLN